MKGFTWKEIWKILMFWHVVCFLLIHSLNHRIKLSFLKGKVFFTTSQKLVRSMFFNLIFDQYQTNFIFIFQEANQEKINSLKKN